MSATAQAILSSWSFDAKMGLGIIVALVLYVRGWLILHRTLPARFSAWRLSAFAGGFAALWLAIASPLDALSSQCKCVGWPSRCRGYELRPIYAGSLGAQAILGRRSCRRRDHAGP